jgi:uncharacterized protein (DUF302 family)
MKMAKRHWGLLACAAAVAVAALGGMIVFGPFGKQSRGEEKMSDTRFTVDHVRVTTDRPFEDVRTALERQLGHFDPEVYKALAAGGNAGRARARIEAMAGPSGLMLFGTNDHGALLRLEGQTRKAVQYVVGNPLFALQMTQHDIRASLYAPLRVLIYENEGGKTCLEYDRPSSLFGQFGNASVTEVAIMLHHKLEQLVAEAIQEPHQPRR